MRKVALAVLIATALAAGCGNTVNTSNVNGSGKSLDQLFEENNIGEFCDGYSQMLGLGWNNDSIYDEAKVAGAFDGYPSGTSRQVFDAAVKYCYKHNF